MATTSPDNIRTPNPGDPYNLVPDLQTLAGDVQDALIKRANRYIGSTAQMNATAAPNGTEWFNTTNNREYVRKSGAWKPVDTGWTNISSQLTVGYRGTLRHRIIGDIHYLSYASGSSPSTFTVGATDIGTLDNDLLPAGINFVHGSANLSGNNIGIAYLNASSGELRVIQQTGATRATANFTMSYPA